MLEKSTLTTHNPSTLPTYIPLISMNHNSHVPLLRRHIHSESPNTESLMQAGTQWHLLLTSVPNDVNVNDPPLILQWLTHILTICIMWVLVKTSACIVSHTNDTRLHHYSLLIISLKLFKPLWANSLKPTCRITIIIQSSKYITQYLFTSRPFLKTAGGIVLGSVAVSAVSAVSADVLPYISVAIKASFLKLGMCNICKNNIAKMFLDFWKILNCSFDRRFKNFWQKIVCTRNLKNRWVDFHKICTAGTSKLVDVQCKFMFKSDNKILSYGRFKILVQACPGWGDGNDPDFFVSSLYISVAIKVRFLKFNMFNRYKNNISKLVLVFFQLQNPWFKIAFLTFLKIELDFHEI